MAAGSNSIVEDWLRSVNLVQYTQAFLDNGYDDLEVCKQIGADDLDAIGVPKDEHRDKLLRAVKVLREEGGTAVYFTLEECDTCQSGDETEVGEGNDDESCSSSSVAVATGGNGAVGGGGSSGGAVRLDAYDMGKTTLVTYPKVQLKLILRDKLVEDNIDLAGPPYTNSDMVVCGSSLTALAIRFAEELKTHFIDVLERLEELWIVARNNDAFYSSMCRSPSRGVYGGSQSMHYGYTPGQFHHPHHHPGSPRSQPPPLPSCPPPPTMSSTYLDRCATLQTHLQGGHVRQDPFALQNYAAVDGGVCCIFPRKIVKESTSSTEDKKKSGSVFGRFLRNIGFRKSNRKGTYKQHQGDLNAYEISMNDDDRMALMILVKEGKITTQTALAVVQKFEDERRAGGGNTTTSEEGKENVCDTPSKKGAGKKKKGGKPTKSHSTFSADDPRCQTCPQEFEMSCDHQICRQRRVHSLGQLDVPHLQPQKELHHDLQLERMALTRAVSCSPACSTSHKIASNTESSTLARLPSPGQHHFVHQQHQNHPSHHHHHHHNLNKVDVLRERLSSKAANAVPKTSSKTSLLSSGSDQSMECGSQTPLRTDPMSRRGGDATTYNSNSTVSMSSDNNSPAPGRKKSGGVLDPRLKCHRSASCSTGDDGISSENDDNENSSRRHFQHDLKKGQQPHESKKAMKIKEAIISRPSLLRQQSAPVGTQIYVGPYLGQAKVIVDYKPGPDEEDFIHLKKGEIVNIINMAQSGVWRGVVGTKRGKFRFEHVEVVIEPDKNPGAAPAPSGHRDVPKSVDDLLQRIGLGHLSNLFMLNGYDDLDIFSELDDHDLDTLHISDPEQRSRLLSATKVLVDWHEKMNVHTPTLTNMDSPSSRAGNSSCDSGCYAGGEGPKHQNRRRGGGNGSLCKSGERTKENSSGYQQSPKVRTPCHSCGKPKQPRKYSGPAGIGHYAPGQYPNQGPSHYAPGHISHSVGHSPYAPGYYPYAGSQQYGSFSPGHYGYPNSIGHGIYASGHPHYAMSASRTLTELNVGDNSGSYPVLETFTGARHRSRTTTPVYGDKQLVGIVGHTTFSDKGAVGDRVSLTEEDQEVIALTYGTGQARKLSTPIQVLTAGSSQLDMSGNVICSMCVPLSGCQQCDDNVLCDSASCSQCAAYASCPQCFPYRHYVNTTMRSDSKSSKMSCSSTCTQTTCLSPDHDENNHNSTTNLIDYATSSPPGGAVSISSPIRGQHANHYPHQYIHPAYVRSPLGIPGRTTPSQLPSPAPAPAGPGNTPPLTLALADPNCTQGVGLTLQTEGQPAIPPVTDWASQADANDAPAIANLYSRGRSATPEKGDKGGGNQVKSPTRSLMPLVSTKLHAEGIDLTELPYSTAIGHCGIPPLLVQRYSEELRQDMDTMALVLEQLREKRLRELGRPCIQNESLSESCKNACDLQISSVQNFLISVGLPMYLKPLTEGGVLTLEQFLKLKESELEQMTGADSRHLKRVAHALEWVQTKLSSPTHKARASGVTDKV